MTNALVVAQVPDELVTKSAENAQRTLSAATRRAYANDWAAFEAWCVTYGLSSLPADEAAICTYLTHFARTHAFATVARAYSAIRVRNEDGGHPLGDLPKVRNVLKALRRELGTAPKQKRALEYHQLCEAADKLPTTIRGIRDRAILLFGELFAGRRSEIAALEVCDLAFSEEGVVVTLRRGKTDQTGKGREVVVHRHDHHCPVGAVEAWISATFIEDGPLFRPVYGETAGPDGITGETIANVVKAAAKSLGLDPDLYGGHSLRRGFITTAAKQGVGALQIMDITGHEDFRTMRRYIDQANPFSRGFKFK